MSTNPSNFFGTPQLVRGVVPKITAPATWKADSAESSAHKFFGLSPKHASI